MSPSVLRRDGEPLGAAPEEAGSPFLGNLPNPGIEPMSPALAGRFFYLLSHEGNSKRHSYCPVNSKECRFLLEQQQKITVIT